MRVRRPSCRTCAQCGHGAGPRGEHGQRCACRADGRRLLGAGRPPRRNLRRVAAPHSRNGRSGGGRRGARGRRSGTECFRCTRTPSRGKGSNRTISAGWSRISRSIGQVRSPLTWSSWARPRTRTIRGTSPRAPRPGRRGGSSILCRGIRRWKRRRPVYARDHPACGPKNLLSLNSSLGLSLRASSLDTCLRRSDIITAVILVKTGIQGGGARRLVWNPGVL